MSKEHRYSSLLTEKQVEKLLSSRVEQLSGATQRARIPFALLIVVSFTLGAHIYLINLGWNQRQAQDVDEYRRAALTKCPCSAPRIGRYHPALALGHDHSKEPNTEFILLETRRKCDSSGGTLYASEECKHLAEAELCLKALDDEYTELFRRRIVQQTWAIPIIEVNAAVSDVGVLGSAAILIILGYFYAASRRENLALAEFIEIRMARRRTFKDTENRELKTGKKGAYWGRLSEPLFSPSDYYVAFESVAHRFVFLSSAPDWLLRLFTISMFWLPFVTVAVNHSLDWHDYIKYYSTQGFPEDLADMGDPAGRLVGSLLLVVLTFLGTWHAVRYQNEIYHALQIWSLFMKEINKMPESDANGLPLAPPAPWFERISGEYNWVLVLPPIEGRAEIKIVTKGEDDAGHYHEPRKEKLAVQYGNNTNGR